MLGTYCYTDTGASIIKCLMTFFITSNHFLTLSSPPVLSSVSFAVVFCFSELSFVTEPSDKRVSQNDHVMMDCLAQGEPPVDVRWQKNGARVLESDHVRFFPNGSLYLSSVSRGVEQSDEGFYQCLARNKYGAILSQRAHLTISSKYGTEITVKTGRSFLSSVSLLVHSCISFAILTKVCAPVCRLICRIQVAWSICYLECFWHTYDICICLFAFSLQICSVSFMGTLLPSF